jgi:hypothetical protein
VLWNGIVLMRSVSDFPVWCPSRSPHFTHVGKSETFSDFYSLKCQSTYIILSFLVSVKGIVFWHFLEKVKFSFATRWNRSSSGYGSGPESADPGWPSGFGKMMLIRPDRIHNSPIAFLGCGFPVRPRRRTVPHNFVYQLKKQWPMSSQAKIALFSHLLTILPIKLAKRSMAFLSWLRVRFVNASTWSRELMHKMTPKRYYDPLK